MNGFSSHTKGENRAPYEDPRLRASPRHGGQGIGLGVTDPPQGRSIEGGGIHRT